MDVIVYYDVDDSVQLTVTAEGDDVTYRWKINNNLQGNENSNTLTITSFSSKTKISVNVSNAIGFDSRTILVQVPIWETESTASQPTILTTSTEPEESGKYS